MAGPTLPPAAPLSIGQSAYLRIRSDIIFGRLVPGARLRLDRLRERYGASVSTLREILNRLSSEGFVVAEGQRGFAVSPISPENLRDVSELRKLLESHALALSLKNGDMDWEGAVVAAHHKLHQTEQRLIAGDLSVKEAWKRYDWEFHQALIEACGSPSLIEAHAAAFDKYLRYQMISLTFRGETVAAEHRRMVEAALTRDVALAQTLLCQHIDNGVEHALASRAISSPQARPAP